MLGRFSSAEGVRRVSMQALLLLGLAILVSGLAMFFYDVSLPYAGFEVAGVTGVGAIDPEGPAEAAGLSMGDRILDIVREGSPADAYLRPDQEALQLIVLRGGQEMSLNIGLTPPPPKVTFNKIGYYVMALAFWIIAMIALVFKPRDPVSQLFVLVALLGTLGIVVWRMADIGAFWANLAMPAIVLAVGPIFVHYHTVFPERISFRGKRALLAGLYGISLILLLLSSASDLISLSRQLRNLGGGPPSLSAVIKVYFCICLIIGLMLLARTYRESSSETGRRQIALIMLGTALASLPLILFILVPQILRSPYVVPSWISLLFLMLIPLSYLYAMYRHNLMKLDRIVNRSVVYFFLSLSFIAVYLAFSVVAQRLIPDVLGGVATLVSMVPVLILVFLLEPVKQKVQALVDGVFYGGWYEHNEFVHRVSSAFKDALDSQTVADLLVNDVAGTMRFKEVALLLAEVGGDEDTFYVRAGDGFDAPMPVNRKGALAASLLDVGEPIQHGVLRDRLRVDPAAQEELTAWSEAGVQMWVPLVQQHRLMGILVLGSKVADEFFTKQDHHALGTLAHQAAVSLARAQLVDRLQGQIHEIRALSRQVIALQERNQKRLSQELHDDVAQDLAFVLRLLEEPVETHSPRKIIGARDVIQQALDRLRDLMFELRPPNLGDDLEKALKEYVASFRRRRNLPVVLHTNGNGVPVPRDVRVALFRICQEGLNNALRHAEAGQIDVTLDQQDRRVRLVVKDDGVGFEVPAHLGSLIDQQHLGLVGMRERAEGVGGSFCLESEPGQGTRISVDVSLEAS